MKPKPLDSLKNLTVPVGISEFLILFLHGLGPHQAGDDRRVTTK